MEEMEKNKTLELKKLYDNYPVFQGKEPVKRQIFSYFKQALKSFDAASIAKFCDDFKNKFRILPPELDARKFCDDFCYKFKNTITHTNKVEEFDIWSEVEEHIAKFMLSHTNLCDQAKQEGWLGEPWKKGKNGLLGYMRTGFALQIKILNNLSIPLPIYQSEFLDYFKSSWFRNSVLKNGIIEPFYDKGHFTIINKN